MVAEEESSISARRRWSLLVKIEGDPLDTRNIDPNHGSMRAQPCDLPFYSSSAGRKNHLRKKRRRKRRRRRRKRRRKRTSRSRR